MLAKSVGRRVRALAKVLAVVLAVVPVPASRQASRQPLLVLHPFCKAKVHGQST
jgi:hypothetical protein